MLNKVPRVHAAHIIAVILVLLALTSWRIFPRVSAAGTTFTVTNTSSAGAGSLAQAILDANANPGADTIAFNIPGAGPRRIIAVLPAITDTVTIDGSTQPGFSGTPVITLDGNNSVTGNGFTINAPNCTVRSIAIFNFKGTGANGNGISISTNGNRISGCYIGVDADGVTLKRIFGDGVLISGGSNNTIGGTTVADRNLIDTADSNGVEISGVGATANIVEGNYIGTDSSGNTAARNSSSGVLINGAPNNTIGGTAGTTPGGACTGACNLISGNGTNGVNISGNGATGNQVLGNFIGTKAAGTAALKNTFGVTINGAPGNTIGGSTTAARNVISGNANFGVSINGAGATNNSVKANFIGTDTTGTAAIGNGISGVVVFTASNTIGGTTAGERNVISGNGVPGGFSNFGVNLSGSGASSNTVAGNYIGTDATGTVGLGNLADGVFVAGPNNKIGVTTNTTPGGPCTGGCNLISGNQGNGVQLNGSTATGNQVNANYIGTDYAGKAAPINQTNAKNTRANPAVNGPLNNAFDGIVELGGGGTAGAAKSFIGARFGELSNDPSPSPSPSPPPPPGFDYCIQDDDTGDIFKFNKTTGDYKYVRCGDGFTFTGNGYVDHEGFNLVLRDFKFTEGKETLAVNAVVNTASDPPSGSTFIRKTDTPSISVLIADSNLADSQCDCNKNSFLQIISGNGGNGIELNNSSNIVILSNIIGSDVTRTLDQHNGLSAIKIVESDNTIVGGLQPFEGNIFQSGPNHPALDLTSGTGNRVAGALYISQADPILHPEDVIDLNSDGRTANGPQPRAGANDLINFPLIQNVTVGNFNVHLTGTYAGIPNKPYTLNIYQLDPATGTFSSTLSAISVTTLTLDNSGAGNFSVDITAGSNQPAFYAATATSVFGAPPAGDTSELSNVMQGTATSTADLVLTQTGAPNPVAPGSNLTYTFNVTNTGPNNTDFFTIFDTLPSGTTFVSCTATDGGTCGGSGNDRTVSFPSLANGASVTATLVVQVNNSVANGTMISHTAVINPSTFDNNSANNSATATVTVMPTTITASPLSANERFIGQVYLDLLNRPVDPAGLNAFAPALNNGSQTREQVVQALLATDEYRQDLVETYYLQFLARTASGSEVAPFVDFLARGGKDEQVISMFAGSPEYFTRAGGTNVNFIKQLYIDSLAREPNQTELQNVAALLVSGQTREQVTLTLLTTNEYQQNLVQGFYQLYLRRDATSTEVTNGLNFFSSGKTDEQFIASIFGSVEYFTRISLGFQTVEGSDASVVIGSLSDTSPASASSYTVTINWGDGASSSGTIASKAGGGFYVSGAHRYAEEGTFGTSFTIGKTDGNGASLNPYANVADALLTARSTILTAMQGAAFTGVVGNFSDGKPNSIASDFTSTINWGDGTATTPGVIIANNPLFGLLLPAPPAHSLKEFLEATNGFTVSGSHTYASAGDFAVNVQISSKGGSKTTVHSRITVTTTAQWQPVALTAQQIAEIKAWTVGGRTYVYVKPQFPDGGYRVINWGQAVRSGNDLTVDASVEKFTGASIQAVVTTAQIYDLGPLADATYNFNFKTSGTLAKTLQFTVSSATPPPNPIDNARAFVKQQYRDFLNREADPAGEDFWTDNITKCSDPARRPPGQTEAQCTLRQRETTSGAFFRSPEFQYTGYFVYRMYQGALARQPKLSEFVPDAQFVGAGIIVNGQLSAAKINQNKADFAAQFVNCTDATKYRCAEFKAIYDGLNNQQYVDKLFQTTGVNASASDRTALVNGLNGGTETRASVLQKVVDGIVVIAEGNQTFTTTYGQAFYIQESNRAFVLLEYFGYMKRDPDDAGYAFWLGKLNQFGGNFVNAEMVLAFISSPEYRARFGQP